MLHLIDIHTDGCINLSLDTLQKRRRTKAIQTLSSNKTVLSVGEVEKNKENEEKKEEQAEEKSQGLEETATIQSPALVPPPGTEYFMEQKKLREQTSAQTTIEICKEDIGLD